MSPHGFQLWACGHNMHGHLELACGALGRWQQNSGALATPCLPHITHKLAASVVAWRLAPGWVIKQASKLAGGGVCELGGCRSSC